MPSIVTFCVSGERLFSAIDGIDRAVRGAAFETTNNTINIRVSLKVACHWEETHPHSRQKGYSMLFSELCFVTQRTDLKKRLVGGGGKAEPQRKKALTKEEAQELINAPRLSWDHELYDSDDDERMDGADGATLKIVGEKSNDARGTLFKSMLQNSISKSMINEGFTGA